MRKLYLAVIFSCFALSIFSQNFYYQGFTAGGFPAGWSPSDGRIVLSNAVPSTGYTSSATSPPASGGNNVRFDHCTPTGETVSLTVSGVINTTGLNNIRVGFGLRVSAAWDREMAFEWSNDGANWNLISSDVSAGATTAWSTAYYDLPSDADNVTNLRFRFSFLTATNANCTAPPNFRIDDFIVGSNGSLPVELLDIYARQVRENIQLDWTTATETNSSHFAVERSADGHDFTEIGRVTSAGTSRVPHPYHFTDRDPLSGPNYYRLRQVDFDGQVAFSPVRYVLLGSSLRAFPSPAADLLYLEWAEQPEETELSWEIFDGSGRRVLADVVEEPGARLEIPVSALPPGAYWIRLSSSRQGWAQFFLKQ